MSILRLAAGLLAGVLLAAAPAAAQHSAAHPAPADSAIPLYRGVLGDFSWKVATRQAEAQEFFDQGVRLMYAFTPTDARRSFAEARRRDPSCAMCWWGEAWSMGPYLNGPMSDADAPAAHAAAARAVEMARAGGSEVERALAAAMAARYAPAHPPHGRKGLDSAFVDAMAEVHRRFPADLQAATLYADALMLLEPRRGLWPLDKPSIPRIHGVLESVLSRDLGHPGACHLYIHATETTPRAAEAQRCADLLVTSIPGASHLNHMPSHTYNRVGRWGDATRSNLIAWHSDLKAERGEGFAIYPAHNLHMLLFSAAVDGQSAIAIQAARDHARLVGPDGASFRALTLLRFGRWAEILEIETAPAHPIHRGLLEFARGHAHLRLGRPAEAADALARVDSLAAHAPATQTFRTHRPATLLGAVAAILRGEILRAEGRTDEALAAFGQAVALEDQLVYDEPEPLPFAARDWLGAALLDAGRAAEAERVFRAALEDRPHNGWSLTGLEQALRAQGRGADADAARALRDRAWQRSDAWIPAARF